MIVTLVQFIFFLLLFTWGTSILSFGRTILLNRTDSICKSKLLSCRFQLSFRLLHTLSSREMDSLSKSLLLIIGTIGCKIIEHCLKVSIVMLIIVSSISFSWPPLFFNSHGFVVSKKLLAACNVCITESTTK